jgi:hypothetical protein
MERRIFNKLLGLYTPTLFIYISSSFGSLDKLEIVEFLPSINSFRCLCCCRMVTISSNDVSTFIVASYFRILYLEE